MKNIQLFSTDLDLSSPVTIPQNSTGNEQVLITGFSLSVPSTVTVDVQYSTDGVNFVNLHTGLNNTEKSRGGVLWRKMKFTKTGGAGTTVSVNYGQGISLTASTDAPSSTTITNIPTNSSTADAEANPSTSRMGALNYSYNGTTWDRDRSGIVTVATTFVGWSNTLSAVRYNATPPTLADGNVVVLQGDVNGNLKTVEQKQAGAEDNTNQIIAIAPRPLAGISTYAWSVFNNFGANATLNVKATAGNVHSIYCQNTNAAIRYIQIHNTATTPGVGAVPALSFMIPASGSVFIDSTQLGILGDYFSTGIAFAFSPTAGTYTAGTAGEQFTTIHYK